MTWFSNIQCWEVARTRYPVGTTVTGRVFDAAHFGVFVELGAGLVGLLEVVDMAGVAPIRFADYPRIGETVTAQVIWHRDNERQVALSQRA